MSRIKEDTGNRFSDLKKQVATSGLYLGIWDDKKLEVEHLVITAEDPKRAIEEIYAVCVFNYYDSGKRSKVSRSPCRNNEPTRLNVKPLPTNNDYVIWEEPSSVCKRLSKSLTNLMLLHEKWEQQH